MQGRFYFLKFVPTFKNNTMKKLRPALLALLLLVSATTYSQQLKVKSDAVKISFIADMQKTEGTVGGFEATINFDVNDLEHSSVKGSVDVSTLSTGNRKRDEHLKSEDFFDAEKYPKMTFSSTEFSKKDGKIVMKGKMKIKSDEHDEVITLSYADKTFKGECTIQVSNYDLGSFSKKKPEKTDVVIQFEIPVE